MFSIIVCHQIIIITHVHCTTISACLHTSSQFMQKILQGLCPSFLYFLFSPNLLSASSHPSFFLPSLFHLFPSFSCFTRPNQYFLSLPSNDLPLSSLFCLPPSLLLSNPYLSVLAFEFYPPLSFFLSFLPSPLFRYHPLLSIYVSLTLLNLFFKVFCYLCISISNIISKNIRKFVFETMASI